MRQMLRLGLSLALCLTLPAPALAQSPADLSIRQVEAVHGPGEDAPPPTSDLSPATDGLQVVLEDEGGIVYELGPAIITEAHVRAAEPERDASGKWSVLLTLTSPAAARFTALTSQLACLRDRGEGVESRLAIVVDGLVVTAAQMEESTAGGEGVECGTGITTGRLAIPTPSEQEAAKLAGSFGWVEDEGSDEGSPVVPLLLIAVIVLATGAVAFRRAKRPLRRPKLGDDA